MKVYFAATYSMREKLLPYREQLQALGIEVTSRWLDETESPQVQIPDLPEDRHVFYGNRDVEDLIGSNILVTFNDPKDHVRQGRTAEFGMAVIINRLIRNMPIMVVGMKHEHIFHYQENIYHFATWEETRDSLMQLNAVLQAA